MTNADRLSKAIQALGEFDHEEFADLKAEYAIKFVNEHAEFLIHQAERVEELEKEKQQLLGRLEQEMELTERVADMVNGLISKNNRYKQALEFYADKKTYQLGISISIGTAFPRKEPIKYDKGSRARKELKEDE